MDKHATRFAPTHTLFLQLSRFKASAGTTGSNVCGGTANTAFFHTNANAKTVVAANIACSPGQSFSVTAYVVFAYSSAYVSMSSQVLPSPPKQNRFAVSNICHACFSWH